MEDSNELSSISGSSASIFKLSQNLPGKLQESDFRIVGGAFPGRDRAVNSDYKGLVFNKIAACEGASHGFETPFS